MITESILTKPRASSVTTNLVLRNTYLLLSLTLLFSGCASYYAMATNVQPMGLVGFLVGMFGLSFLTSALRNSRWGLLAIFAFTGFMGYLLGPILNMYIHGFSNGTQIVTTALSATGLIFLTLSGYVLVTHKNFSYLGGFITIAAMAAFIAGIGGVLFNLPMLQILISCAFAVISSSYILYTTSEIIHGGETNVIMATITLYVALFNLFVSLLQILSFFSGSRK